MTIRRDYPKLPLCGVGVLVWRGPIDAGEVLLVRRARPPRQGQWSIPGGLQELGETCVDAARREVLEETGVEIQLGAVVDVIDLIERDDEGLPRYHYTLIDFVAEWVAGEAVSGDGVSDILWVKPEELKNLTIWDETIRVIHRAAAMRATSLI